MGQAITKLASITSREVKMYNLERRAEKVISKDKPTPAPKYPSTVKELERLKEENVSTEYLYKKDEQLDEFLKKVYVSTPDPAPPLERKINPNRPLPVKRHTDTGITYGYSESEEAAVPEGRVSLKQSLTFISNHQNDPKKYSSAAIASQYKMPLADTNDILEYFKMFAVRVQKKEVDPASLSAYERLQLKVKNMTAFNAPDVLKEIKNVYGSDYGKDLKSDVVKRSDEQDSPPDRDLEKAKEKTGSETTMVKAEESKDSKKEEILEKEKRKPEDDVEKGSTRKHSQENG